MVEYANDKILTGLLKAVSDTTRRSLLTQLCQQGSSRVTDLADYYDMSLNAISKHIKVLEKAGLVTRKTIGRTHWIEANLKRVSLAENWFKELKSIWELRLEKLDEIMKKEVLKMTDLTVNINKTIHAPIEKVFDAWLNPKMLSKFMMPMPGMPDSEVENDAREGGNFTIIMHAGDDKLPHTGEYLEINRPDKLVFTWVSHNSVDNSTVTLNFTKIDDNKTNISLSHVKFIDEKARSDHEGGWGNILDKLNDVMS
jgi:uncharacterized protein YndB with AHSA1/START domain